MRRLCIYRTKDLFASLKSKSFYLLNEKYQGIQKIKLSEFKKELLKKIDEKFNFFTYAMFICKKILKEDTPIISSNFSKINNMALLTNNITKLIFLPKIQFNTTYFGLELNFELVLGINSTFWIFNRIKDTCEFDEFTAVMKLEVTKNNTVTFSYGNFIKNEYNDLIFRIITKEQIILENINNLVREDIISYLLREENKPKDYSFSLKVIDTNNEKIITLLKYKEKIFDFEANWYLPVTDYKYIMFGGTGLLCKLDTLSIQTYEINNSKFEKS